MPANRKLDLVLVNPGNRSQVFQSLASDLAAIEPPIWAALIATFIRARGFAVQIVDAEAEGLSFHETATRIIDMDPILTAVIVYGHQPSASTQNMPAAGKLCAQLKERAPNLKTILVGGHVAALPECTLREENVDFTCDGEGTYTILQLLQALRDEETDFAKVGGLLYRNGDKILHSGPGSLVKDLDVEMPGMAWDLLPMQKYRAHNWHCFGDLVRQPYASFYTTLGCPFRCSFCCIQAPFKTGEGLMGLKPATNSYRMWKPKTVIAEIDQLVNTYGVRNIKIADELFVLNAKHVNDLCDLIIERNYDLNIWAYARVDTVKEGMVEKLKRAGVQWLAFGIEAASERVRDDVDKGFDQSDIAKTIGEVRAAGMNVIGNFIFGLPEDDLSSMQATLDLALELNCEFANFYVAMAYPGSQLYNHAVRKGWPLPETWSGYSQHAVDTLPLPTKYLSAGEVLHFRDQAFQIYYNSANYLDMISRKFGAETRAHLHAMASHRLERRFAS
jgi:anaerobic magnesium-protoporphyrin IX monomethyl ester cyclase